MADNSKESNVTHINVGDLLPVVGLFKDKFSNDNDYLLCDGQTYLGEDYPELFNHLKETNCVSLLNDDGCSFTLPNFGYYIATREITYEEKFVEPMCYRWKDCSYVNTSINDVLENVRNYMKFIVNKSRHKYKCMTFESVDKLIDLTIDAYKREVEK